MKIKFFATLVFVLGVALFSATATWAYDVPGAPPPAPKQQESDCVTCHAKSNPGLVTQYRESKHANNDDEIVDCAGCHGEEHTGDDDAALATMPTQGTCKKCHSNQVEQFQRGKHNLAWAAADAIPMLHNQPIGGFVGQKGCGNCHKIGEKNQDGLAAFAEAGQKYGISGCDSCHTRHSFSTIEARRPETCSNCHMGFDHPQWEMYNSSKHGIIFQIEKETWDWETSLADGATYRAPTCQYCHMDKGDHEVRTSWGFLGLRVEERDEEWAAVRASILKAVGALTPEAEPGPLFEAVGELQLARLTMADWNRGRKEMLEICTECHSETFARTNLETSDELLKESDKVLAQSIETIKGLYEDGILEPAEGYPTPPYPFLLAFYDAPTDIEQDLYLQWMEYRQRAFQGAFHNSADYMHWYGWAPLNETAIRIENEAKRLREEAASK